ncbi:MAG: MgtC/SapB family protein [Myxococcales bacterium]|nr:MAG: MgtC/SapB family protein [Myxococcales bacterium]TFH24954.1 MAG: MgtC/SapB family protein [Myxococcales bacterium]
MIEIFDLLDQTLLLHSATSILCGGVVGLERQLRGKAIGIRTSILICLGTQVFVGLGASMANELADSTRVLGQVVTGIGFLGAGVILSRGGEITGVTSASVVWVLAAIGSTIGAGNLIAAITLAVLTVVILIGARFVESLFKRVAGGSDEPDTESDG